VDHLSKVATLMMISGKMLQNGNALSFLLLLMFGSLTTSFVLPPDLRFL
jgi:hypothetical protein